MLNRLCCFQFAASETFVAFQLQIVTKSSIRWIYRMHSDLTRTIRGVLDWQQSDEKAPDAIFRFFRFFRIFHCIKSHVDKVFRNGCNTESYINISGIPRPRLRKVWHGVPPQYWNLTTSQKKTSWVRVNLARISCLNCEVYPLPTLSCELFCSLCPCFSYHISVQWHFTRRGTQTTQLPSH